jgi:hypothetical protein
LGANQTKSDGTGVGASVAVGVDVDWGKGVSVGCGRFVGRGVSDELQLTAARQTIITAINRRFEYVFTDDLRAKHHA